ncbi:MAG: hypothetical protein J6X54_01565 [Treponema sp.]|nr:hypothetical protein [Treponema sp.]
MADETISRTADWEPGTLEKTRQNIGNIDASEAAAMAKKFGGQNLYEKSSSGGSSSGGSSNPNKNAGRIMRATTPSKPSTTQASVITPKRHIREDLPVISKKVNNAIDKLMMSNEYKIKPNYGFFNFVRAWQKNGTEKVLPEFYEYKIQKAIEHMEAFITVTKTLIQIAPATYKSKIVNGNETKFKFLRMIAAWGTLQIKTEYATVKTIKDSVLACDLTGLVRAIYKPIITVYYYGTNKIPKLIKEIYNDEISYPDSPKDKLSTMAKQAITEWLYLDTEIIKKFYPLLMRMCSDTFEPYPDFFQTKVADILKFTGLHKFDLLLPDKPKEEQKKEDEKPKNAPPQKGVKDATVVTGLKILNQMFPQAGFDALDEHPDMYPYFQPLFKFPDGFNVISPENPIQVTMVLQHIIEECFQGCRNIKFASQDNAKQGSDSIQDILDEWAAYREDSFERLYCEPLVDLTNSVYSQPDFESSHIGKKILNTLLWQTTYHFLPNFKFDKILLERPQDESKYRPLFHRTDFARKYLTLVINECDSKAKTKDKTNLVENPWEHYNFQIQNEVSKRLDVLLGAQNKTATTSATNANLLKYTLCFIAVLDWWINNPGSPAYTTDPMHIYRISNDDGKPVFSVPERSDQNSLFVEAIKANYQKKAQ